MDKIETLRKTIDRVSTEHHGYGFPCRKLLEDRLSVHWKKARNLHPKHCLSFFFFSSHLIYFLFLIFYIFIICFKIIYFHKIN